MKVTFGHKLRYEIKTTFGKISFNLRQTNTQRHFTHEIESLWPLHFKHSHCWQKAELVQVRFTRRLRDQRSMWMQDGCKVCMGTFLRGIKWIMFYAHLDHFQKPLLEGMPNTKPLGDHGTPNAHNCWFILLVYHAWGPAWIEIHWGSIWLRAQFHMTSLYTWGSMITLHDFGGVLGQPLDTFFGLSQFHGHGFWLVCQVALSLWDLTQSHPSFC
jgi:hypothetical protein